MSIEFKNIKFEGDVYKMIYDAFNIHAEGQTGIKKYWEDEICLAAFDDETSNLLGIILFAICGGQLWISQLYVMEESRGKMQKVATQNRNGNFLHNFNCNKK